MMQMIMVSRRWNAATRSMMEIQRKQVEITKRGRWLAYGNLYTFDPVTLKQTRASKGSISHHLEPLPT